MGDQLFLFQALNHLLPMLLPLLIRGRVTQCQRNQFRSRTELPP